MSGSRSSAARQHDHNAACSLGSTVAHGVGSIVSGIGNSILDAVATG